jgi:sigma-E factor negative regulatory protein RseC
MIEEEARVIAIDSQWALIAVEKTSSCGSCHANQSCGTRSIADYFNFKPPRIRVRNRIGAKAGDRVLVSVSDSTLVSVSLLMYILPLLMMIASAVCVRLLFTEQSGEGWQIVAGLAGLAVGLLLVRNVSARFFDGSAVRLERILHSSSRPVIFPS